MKNRRDHVVESNLPRSASFTRQPSANRNLWPTLAMGLLLSGVGTVAPIIGMGPALSVAIFTAFIVTAMIVPPQEVLILFACAIPLAPGTRALETGPSVVSALMLIMIFRTLIRRTEVPTRSFLVALVLAGISLANTVIRYQQVLPGLNGFLTLALVIVVGAYLRGQKTEQVEQLRRACAWGFMVSIMMAGAVGKFLPNLAHRLTTNVASNSEYAYRFFGVSTPWEFAQQALIGIALAAYLRRNWRISILLTLSIAGFLTWLIILSGTFSALLSLALIGGVFLWTGPLSSMPKLILVPSVAAAAGAIISAAMGLLADVRGEAATDNGRLEIWAAYIGVLNNDPVAMIIGFGAGSISIIAAGGLIPGGLGTHNIILDFVIQFGLFGMILLVGVAKDAFRGVLGTSLSGLNWLPLAAVLLTTATQSSIGNDAILFALLFAIPQDQNQDPSESPSRAQVPTRRADSVTDVQLPKGRGSAIRRGYMPVAIRRCQNGVQVEGVARV